MGDSTKPSTGGEGGNLVHLPIVKQTQDSGKHEVVPQAPISGETNGEVPAEVIAAISGIQDETASEVDEKIGELVKIDFKKGRKKGLASSHAQPKKRGKPDLRVVKRPKAPRPEHIEGLGVYAKVETPEYDVISGGKRKKTNKAVIDKDKEYAERTGRNRLLQIAGIMEDELKNSEEREITGPDVRVAAIQLLALGVEDFAREKRETDHRFFHEVCKILFKLWPRNYRRYLNDQRIIEMMQVIRSGAPQGVVLSTMVRWHQHPLH